MRKNQKWDEKKSQIRDVISNYFGVDFLQKTRKREVCYPRQIYMHCLRKFTRLSLAIKTLRNLSQYNDKIRQQILEIESLIE